jgi:hypothetical protein
MSSAAAAIQFRETLESMKGYKYWEQTMDHIYKGDYKTVVCEDDDMSIHDKSYTIDILDKHSIKEQKDPISYWRDTMSKVYELYPEMAM